MPTQHPYQPLTEADFRSAFPGSRKVFVEARGVRVPMREITLSGGEPPLRVYDPSGPLDHDVRRGLPPVRDGWIRARGDVDETPRAFRPAGFDERMPAALAARTKTARRGRGAVTQLHDARQGIVTPEMEFVALR